MWAEVTIRVKENLPANLNDRLSTYFQDGLNDKQVAIEQTSLEPALLPQILLARRSKEAITLLLSPDLQKVKAYIDNGVGSKTLEPLKREIAGLREDLKRFLRTCNSSIQELTILIGAEGDTLFVGQYLGLKGRISEAFKDHAIAKFYVPLAAYIASIILGSDQQRALANVVTALIALGLWVILDGSFLRPSLVYKG